MVRYSIDWWRNAQQVLKYRCIYVTWFLAWKMLLIYTHTWKICSYSSQLLTPSWLNYSYAVCQKTSLNLLSQIATQKDFATATWRNVEYSGPSNFQLLNWCNVKSWPSRTRCITVFVTSKKGCYCMLHHLYKSTMRTLLEWMDDKLRIPFLPSWRPDFRM